MRRAFRVLVICPAIMLLSGAGQPAPQRLHQYTDAEQADLGRLSDYLNGIQTLKSNFVQLGPDGQLDQGTFFLEKPGKMRFEYQPPSPTLMVATGGDVYVKNARLNTVDRYSLSDTPLGILLDADINLKRNSAILGVEEQSDALILHARTSNNRSQSNITLVFSFPGIELRQWMVKDNQGTTTTIALTGVQTGMALPDSLFAVPVKAPPIKKAD